MDRMDVKILRCLRENARMNAKVIGEQVQMSVSAVIERIRKLEASGIIKRYTVLLDSKLVGKDISAFISVSLEHPKYNDGFVEAVKRNNQVVECSYVTGDFDYILKVASKSTEDLTYLLGEIESIQGVNLTKTLIVLNTFKNDVSVLPDMPD